MTIVIKVENLSKQYRLGIIGGGTLYGDLNRWWARLRGKPDPTLKIGQDDQVNIEGQTVWALRDISFEVQEGEVLGIIGRNGAGKSTLLKILSRITGPTSGLVKVKGRVGSLLEVGTGFHPELTGRENIFLNGAILGMSQTEVERKFDEIVDFSGVEQFIDTPVKRYSSGMYVRLAFAVAAHLDPEILVVDEVLAVGDAEFQKKCLGKMGEVANEGRTVLFVSHNMAAIGNLCGRTIILNQGLIAFVGTQTAAISEYQRSFSENRVLLQNRTDRKGTGDVKIVGIEFRDLEGRLIDCIACGQDFDILFHFETSLSFRSDRVVASFIVKTQWEVPVFLHHNRMTGDDFGWLPDKGTFVCRILRLPLTPSVYKVGYSIMIGTDYLDAISDATELNVIAGDFFGSGEVSPSSHGFCLVEGHWSLES